MFVILISLIKSQLRVKGIIWQHTRIMQNITSMLPPSWGRRLEVQNLGASLYSNTNRKKNFG